MSLFNPDPGAIPNDTSIVYLAQRDVSFSIPINHNTYSGVAVTAACFANGKYEEASGTRCISNLLGLGFRRINLDIYWDVSGQKWSLCPVELGGSLTSSVSLAAPTQETATISQASLAVRDHFEIGSINASTPLQNLARATSSATSSINGSTTLSDSTTTGSLTSSATYLPAVNGSTVTIGPYTCSASLDLYTFMEIVSAFLDNTQTTINATTLILTTHIHAASEASNPTGSAQKPPANRLPQGGAFLSSVINTNASAYLYSPSDLAQQRSDLNGTDGWSSVIAQNQPSLGYFTVDDNNGHYSTPDGWPNEDYIVLSRKQRLLVQFGNIDPQMDDYNFSVDATTIFPPNFLGSTLNNNTTSSTGSITSPCFFNPNITSLTTTNNASWAVTPLGSGSNTPSSQQADLLSQSRNLTLCGISPVLNSTLDSSTADADFLPYQQFVRSTIWSWAPGQPINASANISTAALQCAALNATSGWWYASDCTVSHYGACHDVTRPYGWSISASQGTYHQISGRCGKNASFDVPRTALENAYLLEVWRAHLSLSASSDDDDDDDDDSSGGGGGGGGGGVGPNLGSGDRMLWLDFNDLAVDNCWVIGENSTCPYSEKNSSTTHRVVVSTVSSIVVLAIAGLLLLTKCAGNHQSSKRRRRRGGDGWDYEGVPS